MLMTFGKSENLIFVMAGAQNTPIISLLDDSSG
jgi:hypothetical protein